jgi:hypothetical protein
MPDKKTYKIDENALREKFTAYTVSFNADSLSFLENEVAQVKTHNPIELPETKKIVQFIGIPVAIALLGCGAYFGFNYIKNLPATAPKKDSIAIVKPIVAPKPEIKQETPPPVNTASIASTPDVKKQDTIIATIAPTVKNKEKKSTEQAKTVKKDTTQINKTEKTKLDTVEKKNKVDTASVSKSKDTLLKKKKKKRKNTLDATDDIRKSQPNSADDDVIIPDNSQQ